MDWLRWMVRRLRFLFRKEEVERELDDELTHHLELEARELERQGMTPGEARREAYRRFGGVERAKERVRDERGGRWIEDAFQDLRHALRALRRSPGFGAVAVLILGLGIGSVVATTSLVHGVLFRPPAFEEPDRLLFFWQRLDTTGGGRRRIPAPDVARIREAGGPLQDVAFLRTPSEGVVGDGLSARSARIGTVTPNFFTLLGVEARAGRTFRAREGSGFGGGGGPDPASVVLSHAFWSEAYGGDPGVVGSSIRVNGIPRPVVGVLSPAFRLWLPPDAGIPAHVDIWAPLPANLEDLRREPGRLVDQDSDNTGVVIGRLAPGASVDAARERMDAVARTLRELEPAYASADLRIEVAPLMRDAVAHVRPVLLSLLGAVALVLLVACLDVSTLLLARGERRSSELALRAALGAGRGRLLRQELVESGLLALVGAGVGVLGARLAVNLVVVFGPPGLPGLERVSLYPPALLVAVPAVLVAVVSFGLVPTLRQGWSDAGTLLSARSDGSAGRRGDGMRTKLVAGEIALSLVLLVGTGLLLRSVLAVQDRDPGFRPEGALSLRVSLRGSDRYPGPAERARFVREMEEAMAAVPGVEGVGVVGALPLGGREWTQPWGFASEPMERWEARTAHFRVATSGYFAAAGIRVLAGRSFLPEEDLEEGRRVVVVDRTLARELGGFGVAVGRRLGVPLDGRPVEAEVVGVVETVLQESLTEEPLGSIYVPYRQEASREVAVVARARPGDDPEMLVGGLRDALARVDAEVPLYGVRTMADYLREATGPLRFALGVISGFAVLAVVLTLVGLYGVVSYVAQRRRRELAVRRALGADRLAVVGTVLRDAARTTAAGVALGLGGALLAGPALRALLVGVRPEDPVTLAGAALLLGASAIAASLVPALRAVRADLVESLKGE